MKWSKTAKVVLGICLCLLSISLRAASDPVVFLQNTASYVVAQVDEHRDELEQDSSKIYSLVEARVVPYFDFYLMSRSALGRHWRKAGEEQRKQLSQEFQKLLVRTYALALLNYSGQHIQYLPFRGDPAAKKVVVNTRVKANGSIVPIDYRLHKQRGEWLIYDVMVDGMSLVTNYRSSFNSEVVKGGVDGLIAALAEKNRT